MRKIKKPDAATLKALLPYGMIGLLATKLGQAYRLATGADIIDRPAHISCAPTLVFPKTTAPAATTAPSPTSAPSRTTAFIPMSAPLRTVQA